LASAGTRARQTATREERKKALGGQNKSLKRLVSDKEIKGNPSVFLGFIWLGLGWILLDLAKFGFGLD
jgi:hypothetical protein